MQFNLSPRTALIVFISLVTFLFAQAIWWIVFMARTVGDMVELAESLGASPEAVAVIREREIGQQVMVGLEGSFFLLVLLGGIWLIYRALVRTEQLKYRQQNFLMAVTHELKTPLSSINLYLDTLASTKIAPEKKQQVLPRAKEDVKRLEKLVEDILDASRFERDSYRLYKEQFDFSRLVTDTAEQFRRRPHRLTLNLTTTIEPSVEIFGDPRALGRAVDTILDNAAKYSRDESLSLTIALEKVGGRVRLTIADDGIGVAKNELGVIFERFYRVGNELTRTSQGSGLGLYLCRETLRAHGGEVKAASDGLGSGTQFVIDLPQGETE